MNSGLRKWLTCLSILFTVFTFSGAAPDYKISQRCAIKNELRVVIRRGYKKIAGYFDLLTAAYKCVLHSTSNLKFSLLVYSRVVDVKCRNNIVECNTYSLRDKPGQLSYTPRNISDVMFDDIR